MSEEQIKKEDKGKYTVESYKIAPYVFRKPLTNVDDNGEVQLSFSSHTTKHIKSITFLNMVGRDEKGKAVSYEPLVCANAFLLSLHIDDNVQESDGYSKGLISYFSFLIALQEKWDKKYVNEDLDDLELFENPRPEWDIFARRKSNRPTYMYHAQLKKLAGTKGNLAKTTATKYMNAVVSFYKHHIHAGHKFNQPPMKYEIVRVTYDAEGTSMKQYRSREIISTDLRLTFPKSQKNEGGALAGLTRDLKPLNPQEWELANQVIKNRRVDITRRTGRKDVTTLGVEYSLLFRICRYAGLRREEAASLHLEQVFEPDENARSMVWLTVGDEAGSLTKTVEGDFNKSRKTVIPTSLMREIYEYTLSERYETRKANYKAYIAKQREIGNHAIFEGVDYIDEDKDYLFITEKGHPLFYGEILETIGSRWGEVRNTVNRLFEEQGSSHRMVGSVHNLRPTFSVNLFRVLLAMGMNPDDALARVSSCLGHEDYKTTLKYLRYTQEYPAGDEIWEDFLDFLNVFTTDEDNITPLTQVI